MGKGDFANVIKDVRWGKYPELFRWAYCNHRDLTKRKKEVGRPENDLRTENTIPEKMLNCWL